MNVITNVQTSDKSRGRGDAVILRATFLLATAAVLLLIYGSPFKVAAAQTESALCVVDDSRDMTDSPKIKSFNGFGSVKNKWPILTYLLPELECDTYCSWTEFRTRNESCRSSGTVQDPRIPQPLQATSPLASTIAQTSKRDVGRNVFFVTNGIDWLIEGGQYAVEMDISGALTNWLTAKYPSQDIVLGMVQDNVGRMRRPNMVVGFVRGFIVPAQADASCTWSPVGTPQRYKIGLTAYHNPQRVLNDGSLEIEPLMTLLFSLDGGSRMAEYMIAETGRVDVPNAIIQNAKDIKLNVTFRYPSEHTGNRLCWGIQGQFGDFSPMEAICKPSSDGFTFTCELLVPLLQGAIGSSWKLSFSMVPQKPSWIDVADLDATHALNITFNSFYNQVRLPTRVRVMSVQGRPNQPINSLTLISR